MDNSIYNINILKNKFNLYTENYKASLREIKEDLNNWQDIHVHGLEDLILLR